MTGSIAFLSDTRSDCELTACNIRLNIGRQRLSDAEYESLLKKSRGLKLLDAQRKIGLCATDTCLLTPRKSITAICGEASVPVKGALAGCATCALRETCQKRKEGNPCHGAV